jgi:hypothetical protein
MAFLGVDRRGIPGTAAGDVGDDFAVNVVLFDFTSGAVTGVGATVVATVAGVSMAVNSSTTAGLYVCSLTDAQTTTLGSGAWTWLFRHTPAAGDTQTYIRGTVHLMASSNAGGSTGWQAGIVGNTLVGIG